MTMRDQVRKLIEFEPTLSNAEIARVLGCTRQNISYHAKRLALRRQTSHLSCIGGCGRRVSRRLKSGMCRACWRISHAYEFICVHCGTLKVVYGGQAASRRRNNRYLKTRQRDFCDRVCANRHNRREYWALRKLDPGTAQRL